MSKISLAEAYRAGVGKTPEGTRTLLEIRYKQALDGLSGQLGDIKMTDPEYFWQLIETTPALTRLFPDLVKKQTSETSQTIN